MGDDAVTPPPAFSPLTSEFNAFLFAPIGEESNNAVVTVLSAFARLGTDPWQESARLARLPRQAAVQSLTSIIAELPNGNWPQSETGAIAARLVELLPRKRVLPVVPRKRALLVLPRAATRGKAPAASRLGLVLILVLLGGLIFFAVVNRVHAAAAGDVLSPPPAICGAVAMPAPAHRL
jgi:hypothetical protein